MKKIALAFTLSVLALAGCSSEATSVDTGSTDTQTQADALQAKAIEFASQVTFDRDGKAVVPADWTPMKSKDVDTAEIVAEHAKAVHDATNEGDEGNAPGGGEPSHAMRSSCWDTGSYVSCCYYYPTFHSCCVSFPDGYGYCHG